MATELFEDIFEVRQINPDGKKFDKGACAFVLIPIRDAAVDCVSVMNASIDV